MKSNADYIIALLSIIVRLLAPLGAIVTPVTGGARSYSIIYEPCVFHFFSYASGLSDTTRLMGNYGDLLGDWTPYMLAVTFICLLLQLTQGLNLIISNRMSKGLSFSFIGFFLLCLLQWLVLTLLTPVGVFQSITQQHVWSYFPHLQVGPSTFYPDILLPNLLVLVALVYIQREDLRKGIEKLRVH